MEKNLNTGSEGVSPGLPGAGLSAVSPSQSLGRIRASIPDAGLHSTHTVVFKMSRCHTYAGTWVPEEGSVAHALAQVPRKRSDEPSAKMHWDGGRCASVIGPHAWKAKDRHLNGAQFNYTDKAHRCQMCDFQFMRA